MLMLRFSFWQFLGEAILWSVRLLPLLIPLEFDSFLLVILLMFDKLMAESMPGRVAFLDLELDINIYSRSMPAS